jgi:hypothetical protein
MWLAAVGSALTAIFAAIAAFQLCLPDRNPLWARVPIPAAILLICASGIGCLRSWVIPGTSEATLSEARICLIFIFGLSVPLSIILILMLRRGYSLRPGLTAATGGLACAAAAATLLNFIHPYDASATDLVVHAVAVALVVLASVMVGRLCLPGKIAAGPHVT